MAVNIHRCLKTPDLKIIFPFLYRDHSNKCNTFIEGEKEINKDNTNRIDVLRTIINFYFRMLQYIFSYHVTPHLFSVYCAREKNDFFFLSQVEIMQGPIKLRGGPGLEVHSCPLF